MRREALADETSDRIGGEPLKHKRLVHAGDWTAAGEPQRQVPVLDRRCGFVESANLVEDLTAHNQRLGTDQAARQQRLEDVTVYAVHGFVRDVVHLRSMTHSVAEPTQAEHAAVDCRRSGSTLSEEVHLPLELQRQPLIVAVLKGHPASGCVGHAEIACPCRAGVAVGHDHADARILDRPHHGDRVVRRAIVDDHDVQVRVGLPKDTVDRRANRPGAVVHRDDHRHGRHLGIRHR